MKKQNFKVMTIQSIYHAAGCFLLFVSLIFVTFRCTERQRTNPLDPQNPDTGGKPQSVQIFSKVDTVFLSWRRIIQNNMSHYKIYRTKYPSGTIEKYIDLSPTSTSFTDREVDLGKTYTYQIASVVQDYESPPSDPVTITPGPTYTWILDGETGNILKLTHDCQHLIFKRFFSSFPEYICVNPNSGMVWILDDFSNLIYALNAKGEFLFSKNDYTRPEAVDIHWESGDAWLLDRANGGSLLKFRSTGNRLFAFTGLKNPKGIAVVQNTNQCWLADAQLKTVMLVKTASSKEEINYPFKSPQAVALHQQDGNLWIADSSAVLVFDHQGKYLISRIERENFTYLLAVDQTTGACWVADRTSVSKYNAAGKYEFSIKEFNSPLSIAVNSYNGTCLVVDRNPSRLVQISQDSTKITGNTLVNYPISVSIQNKYN